MDLEFMNAAITTLGEEVDRDLVKRVKAEARA